MKRRSFLTCSTSALLYSSVAPTVICHAAKPDPLQRIGLTSSVFRHQFTKNTKPGISIGKPILDMTYYPEYIRDRFKLPNLEIHEGQLDSKEPAYLNEVRKKIDKAKCTLTNLQCGGWFSNLASTDEDARNKDVEDFKSKYIDVAAQLGAMSVRIEPGTGKSVQAAIKSYNELSRYAHEKGVMIALENHGGLSSDPKNLIAVIKADPLNNVVANTDFGSTWEVDRMVGVKMLAPYLRHQVCAKVEYFDENWNHVPFDFDKCVRLCEETGFKGVYSGEQHAFDRDDMDYEKVADWIIEHVMANI